MIRAEASEGARLLHLELDGDIGQNYWGDGITSAAVSAALREAGDVTQINVRLHSGGGDVFEGFAIYRLLASHAARVEVSIDALAASAASVIAMAGDKITMAESSMMMVHRAWGFCMGNESDMAETAKLLAKIDSVICGIYADRTNEKKQRCAEMMAAETWMTAKEALALGFCDAIVPNKAKPSQARAALHQPFKNAPREVLAALGFDWEPDIQNPARSLGAHLLVESPSPEPPACANVRPQPSPPADDAFGPDGTPRSGIQAAEQILSRLQAGADLTEPERTLAARWASDLRARLDAGTPLTPPERALVASWTDQAIDAFDGQEVLSVGERQFLASLARFALTKARAENLLHAPAAHLDPPNTQPRIGDCL